MADPYMGGMPPYRTGPWRNLATALGTLEIMDFDGGHALT